ncbi:MAG: hypothetical protein ACIAQZ_04815 [Sedimentisphaeraceae bacterium JB056]
MNNKQLLVESLVDLVDIPEDDVQKIVSIIINRHTARSICENEKLSDYEIRNEL